MKRCPSCNRSYADLSLNFCLEDGTPLVSGAVALVDPHATIRDNPPRQTNEPPPTEILRQEVPFLNQVPELVQPRQWAPALAPPGRKKSNAIWWVLGGVAVVVIIGVGLLIIVLALASIGSNTNSNVNSASANANSQASNRNPNAGTANANNTSDSHLPHSELLPLLTDDFSEAKWGRGNFQYGDIWYADDEYHMRSKPRTFLVMYGPSNNYNTENATVTVTTRSVDGSAPTSGYGLIVHGKKSNNELEDYALLIYTGNEPQYQVVMHKGGNQVTLVSWTKSNAIRSGSSPNELQVRAKGRQLTFYINGQYVNQIADNENLTNGLAGFYTSDVAEVVFDDLEIER